MTLEEAWRLKPGDLVRWQGDITTVLEVDRGDEDLPIEVDTLDDGDLPPEVQGTWVEPQELSFLDGTGGSGNAFKQEMKALKEGR